MLKKEYAPIPLAPGTAEIICNVKEMYEKEDKSFAEIKVNEIKEYGPATRPIAVGTVLVLEIKEDYINKFEELKSSNSEIEITIAYTQRRSGTRIKWCLEYNKNK
ncbi:MAG: hypothetical protein H6613_08165 [Ignavibacteriales bacterium]|nr:hypothetical protein [Ignavibacteriales bacterium]